MKDYIPKNWKEYVVWLILISAIAILFAFGLWPKDGPVPLPPVPIFEPSDSPDGWTPNPDEVKAVAATLKFKVFGDTPAGKSDDPLPQAVYLWQSYAKLFGQPPPSKNQGQIGSCVSFGTNNAVARTLATQIVFANGGADEFQDIAEEVTYGGSRVQVGGGKLRGDGSVGAWAAQFVQKWGVVARAKQGAYDLTTYSVATCRTFGDKGVPAELQTVAKDHPIKDITQVTLWDSAKKALASGYGIAICSGVGFEGTRDGNGVKVAKGSWGHCMCLDGYHIEGGKEYGHIENSWGPRPNEGPVGWGNPPDSGFWADSATIQKMLSQNDSWAFSAVRGWPSRKIDWFAINQPRRPGLEFPRFAHRKEVGYAMSF
jgi:hypothetical protein